MTRRSATRQAILSAAISLAAEKGITATTMDDIAERAGVAKGSLYYNYRSKDDIFGTILEQAFSDLAARFRAATAGDHDGVDEMRALVTILLDAVRENTASLRLIAAEVFRTDRSWVEPLRVARDNALSYFETAIRRLGSAKGRTVSHPRLLASAAFGAVLVAALEWLIFEPEVRDEDVVDTLIVPVIRMVE